MANRIINVFKLRHDFDYENITTIPTKTVIKFQDKIIHVFSPTSNEDMCECESFTHMKFKLPNNYDVPYDEPIEIHNCEPLKLIPLSKTIKGLAVYSILCSNFSLDNYDDTIQKFKFMNKLNGIAMFLDTQIDVKIKLED